MAQQDDSEHRAANKGVDAAGVTLTEPTTVDGPQVWRIARDSGVLDLNSSYAYMLWCRDFASTSVVARMDGAAVGFVTGFLRQEAPDTVMVWQVAVDARQRGQSLAGRMLHALVDRMIPRGVRWMETTISPTNEASIRLFSALARERGAGIERRGLFSPQDFPTDEPGDHEAEDLYLIGPFQPGNTT